MNLNIDYITDLYVPSTNTEVDQNFFNRRFKKLYDALTAMNTVVSSYGNTEATLLQLGLARLNETLGPLLTTLQDAAELGFLVSRATGASHSLVETEAIGWVITEGADLFTPTQYLLAQDNNDSTNWGILSLDEGGWTKETGELATHVGYASKTQSSTSWTISANSAVIPVMAAMVADAQAAQAATEDINDDVQALWILIQDVYEAIQNGAVASVNGQTGIVVLATADIVGLTAALADKVSTAQLAAKQDASAKLSALVNLTWAANKLIYATGAGTLGTTDVTDFGKSLIDDANATAALSTLGLTVSTFVKTLLDDADASTFFTTLGVSTFIKTLFDDTDASTALSTLGVSAYAKTLLDDASASDVLTTLGVSTFVKTFLDDTDAATVRTTIGAQDADAQLFSNIPQNSKSAAYTLVAADAQKHIFHPSSDSSARTFTIPSNASVPYPIGTAITFINRGGTVTIAITSDTLRLAVDGTTGSVDLDTNGVATAIKIGTTEWMISGAGVA